MPKNTRRRRYKRNRKTKKKGGFWWPFSRQKCTPTSCQLSCAIRTYDENALNLRLKACCGNDQHWFTRWRNKSTCADLKTKLMQAESNVEINNFDFLERFHDFMVKEGIEIRDNIFLRVDNKCIFYTTDSKFKIPKSEVISVNDNFNSKIIITYFQRKKDPSTGEYDLVKSQKSFEFPKEQIEMLSKKFPKKNLFAMINDYLQKYFCGINVELEYESKFSSNIIHLTKGMSPIKDYLEIPPVIALVGIDFDRDPYYKMIYDENAVDNNGNPLIHFLLGPKNQTILEYKPPNPPKGQTHKYIIVILPEAPEYEIESRRLLTKPSDLQTLGLTYFTYPPVVNTSLDPMTLVAKQFIK